MVYIARRHPAPGEQRAPEAARAHPHQRQARLASPARGPAVLRQDLVRVAVCRGSIVGRTAAPFRLRRAMAWAYIGIVMSMPMTSTPARQNSRLVRVVQLKIELVSKVSTQDYQAWEVASMP